MCLGVKGTEENDADPVIGDNVIIGTGAIVIGIIRVGNNSTIAAGLVVIANV